MKFLNCIIGLLLVGVLSAQTPGPNNAAYLGAVGKVATAGGGGSPAWQYIELAANDDSFAYFSGTESIAHPIIVTGSGNITKVGLQVANDGGDHNLKLALYSNGGTLLGSGTVSVLSTDDDVFKEVTLNTPAANSGTTTYHLVAMADSSDVRYFYLATASSLDISLGQTYASFPPGTLAGADFNDLGRKIVGGAYLVP